MPVVDAIPEVIRRAFLGPDKPQFRQEPPPASLIGNAMGLWDAIAPKRNIWKLIGPGIAIFNFDFVPNVTNREITQEEHYLYRLLEPYQEKTNYFAAMLMINHDYMHFTRGAGDRQPWPRMSDWTMSFELDIASYDRDLNCPDVLKIAEMPQSLPEYGLPYNVLIVGEGPETHSNRLRWELTGGNIETRIPVWEKHHGPKDLRNPRGDVLWRRQLVEGILNGFTAMLRFHSEDERAIRDLKEISQFKDDHYGMNMADMLWLLHSES